MTKTPQQIKNEVEKEYIGKVTYHQGGFFTRAYWDVCDKIEENVIGYSMFYNFERARIYSKLVQVANKLKIYLKE